MDNQIITDIKVEVVRDQNKEYIKTNSLLIDINVKLQRENLRQKHEIQRLRELLYYHGIKKNKIIGDKK